MASMCIKRITEIAYTVRQYDRVAAVDLGEMSGQTLLDHLTARYLVGSSTPGEVIDKLDVGDEITVHFRTN